MEGLHLLPDLIQAGDWMVKLDLKDAYLQVHIHPDHQKYLVFQWDSKFYQFTCLPFGLLAAPRAFTKLLKPSVETGRMLPDNLPGRHPNSSLGQQPAAANYSLSLPAVRMPGLVSEQQEVSVNILPTVGIPRIPTVHYDTENRANSVKRCSQVCWKGSSYSLGFSHSSIVLQNITICNECSPPSLLHTGGHREEIQLIDQNQCGEQGRSDTVGSPRQDHSEYPNLAVKTIRSHQIRCFEQGLGSSAEQSNSNGRSLVSTRDNSPHQLPGDVGCLSSNKSIWQKLEGHYSPDPDGQLHSSDIHQSEGGHLFQTAVPVGNQGMELVPGKEHHVAVRTSPGQAQSDSRYGVKNNERPLRLDAQSSGLPEDLNTDGTIEGESVCFKTNQTASPFLQLETRSGSRSYRCIPTGLGCGSGICQLTMVPDTSMPRQGEGTSCKNGPNSFTEPWFSVLLELLEDYPRTLPQQPDLITTPSGQEFLMYQGIPQLIAWPISGNPIHQKDFLQRLQIPCSPHGEPKQTPIMVPPLPDGLAGVSKGIEIPFRDL